MSELGVRYKCYKCEVKFYDLNRPRPICPSCGEDQANKEVKQVHKPKRRRSYAKIEPDPQPLHEEGDERAETYEEGHESEHEHEADDYVPDKEDLVSEGDDGEGNLE